MTNPMTPTEQNKELREEVLSLFSANFSDGEPIENRVGSRDMYSASAIVEYIDDFILPLITADRKRVALEARLEELNRVSPSTLIGGLAQPITVRFRINELKAQQEEA